MDYQEGYVYHIKDEYFTKANEPNLMQNKEATYNPKQHQSPLMYAYRHQFLIDMLA